MKHILFCIALLVAFLVGGRSFAQTTIEIDVAPNTQATMNVTFTTNATAPAVPLVESWQMTPTMDLLMGYSTCAQLSGQYDPGKLTVLASGTKSADLKMPLAATPTPTHFSIATYSVRGCTPTSPHAPRTVVQVGGPTMGMTTYYVDYGGGQNAIITIIASSGIGTEGNPSAGPVKHGKSGGCCCCGDRSDASYPSNPSDGSKGKLREGMGAREFEPVPQRAGYYPQERSNWCWAAVNQSLLQGTGTQDWQQCFQAKKQFLNLIPTASLTSCSASILNQGVEDYGVALTSFNCAYQARTRSSLPRSAWIVRWSGGGRHAMVLDKVEHGLAYGYDPWPVDEGSYFLMQRRTVNRNAEFATENYYTSIRQNP